jgi:hypothetical protein
MRDVAATAAPRERSDHRSAVARPVEREEAEAAVEEEEEFFQEEEEEFFQIPEADNIGQLAPRPCIDQELLSLPLQGMHW